MWETVFLLYVQNICEHEKSNRVRYKAHPVAYVALCCRRYFFTTFFPFTIYIPRGSRPNGVVSLTPSGV